jgi:ATP-binding cassette subfamily B protein
MLGAGFTVNIVQRGAVSLRRLNEVFDTEPSIKNEPVIDTAETAGDTGNNSDNIISIKNLNLSYNDKQVLSNISLSIKKGTWFGILGRTGSGKTTLVKTLMRLVDPPENTVFVNGKDVRKWDLQDLRKFFGVSPQDSFMFSDSVKNNIVYANEKAADSLVQKMVELAAMQKDIEALSAGIDTLVGERGLTLSGGQKQRLAIARAAILDPEILVLDDSLSAVDAETEKQILKMLEQERAGKTTIIISHRVSAFAKADKAAVLDKGCLTEYGSPEDLLKNGGYYAKTAMLQKLTEPAVNNSLKTVSELG